MRNKRFSLLLLVLIGTLLAISSSSSVYGQDADPPPKPRNENWNGMMDPNRQLTPEEEIFQEAKYQALKEFVDQEGLTEYQDRFEKLNNLANLSEKPQEPANKSTNSYYYYKDIPVGVWLEPNDWDHRNYCGPAATQVTLDARWPASSVPSIDDVGEAENIDPSWGVYMNNVVGALNNYLSNEFPNPNGMEMYWTDSSSSTWDLYNKIYFDNFRDYVTVTGVRTDNMPGWSVNAAHIVSIYGLYSDDYWSGYHYTETAGTVAGYTGAYRRWANVYTFYDWQSANNSLAW